MTLMALAVVVIGLALAAWFEFMLGPVSPAAIGIALMSLVSGVCIAWAGRHDTSTRRKNTMNDSQHALARIYTHRGKVMADITDQPLSPLDAQAVANCLAREAVRAMGSPNTGAVLVFTGEGGGWTLGFQVVEETDEHRKAGTNIPVRGGA